MTRAVQVAELGDQNTFTIDGTNNRVGVGTSTPLAMFQVGTGVTVYGNSGIVSATSFFGDGAGLTGVANTGSILSDSIIVAGITTVNASGVNVTGIVTSTGFNGNIVSSAGTITTLNATTVSVAGTITYNDVTNVDSVGVLTARSGIRVGAGQSISAVSGTLTYYGDGSNLEGVTSGIQILEGGSSKGTSLTSINFASGATITASGAGSTITISAPSISTTSSSPSANTVVTLDLTTSQHHDLTLSAGITTITCSGGSFGDSHSVVLIQPSSGIATVGFSTYFLFPSGASPSISEGSGKIDLLSFVVKRVGAAGTQLLASAGLNYQ